MEARQAKNKGKGWTHGNEAAQKVPPLYLAAQAQLACPNATSADQFDTCQHLKHPPQMGGLHSAK